MNSSRIAGSMTYPSLQGFGSARDNIDFRLLRAQSRVDGFEPSFAGRFLGANPHCSGSADQRKLIVTDDLSGAFNLKLDCVIRKWPNRSELVRHAENYSG